MCAGRGLWHVADPGVNNAGKFAVTAWRIVCILCIVTGSKLLW